MQITIGDHVVYGSAGICRLACVEKRSFDGVHEQQYYKLIPIHSETSSYYIPVDNMETKIRKLLTREEVYALIDAIPAAEPIWFDSSSERKAIYHTILKRDDYSETVRMLKALHLERIRRSADRKKLPVSDEIVMRTAETMMYQEFAFVLGIRPDEVEGLIAARIETE